MTVAEDIAAVDPALRRLARKYASRGLDADDMYQEGMVRVLKDAPAEGEYPPSHIVRRARFAMIDALRRWASDSRWDNVAKRTYIVWRRPERSLEAELERGWDVADEGMGEL